MTMAESLGIHVTGGLQIQRAEPLLAMADCLPDSVTTPPDHGRLGEAIMLGQTGRTSIVGAGT